MNEPPSHPKGGPRVWHTGGAVWGKAQLLLSMFYLVCEEREDFSVSAFYSHKEI